MDWVNILELVFVILCAVTYGFMLYFKCKGNVTEAVSELVALAEATGLAGAEKMAQVVERLYEMVPGWLRKFLSRETLEKLAQSIYDWMRRYSDTREEKKATAAAARETVDAGSIAEMAGEVAADRG